MSDLRIGVLGLTHDHVWRNLRELREVDGAKLVAVADPNKPLVERAKSEHDCAVYREPATMIDREQLDAVYIFGDNASGPDLVALAADHKLPMMVEKPMAASVAGADDMLASARRAGVRMMINWPFAWLPQLQQAIAIAQRGDIGDLWEVKYRAAHEGPRELGCSEYFCDWLYDAERNGAGAYMDYCCYGSALACLLLGLPSRVIAMTGRLVKEDIVVEDNGIIVMQYPKAMAVSEASWSQIGHLTAYVTAIYGTKGQLVVEPPKMGNRLLMATAENPQGSEVPLTEQPAHLKNASANFIHGLTTGEEFMPLCSDRVGRDAQEVLEAGLIAADSGQEVSLPLKR